jgi:hypothetical protein
MEEVLTKLEEYEYDSGAELVASLRENLDDLEYSAILHALETRFTNL